MGDPMVMSLIQMYASFYDTDLSQSVAFSVWSMCVCVCTSHFSKIFFSETTKRILFILDNNGPWMRAFESCILFVHIFKVKVTAHDQHIVKLQNTTPPLFILCHNDPWVKAFKSCIPLDHMFKAKVTIQGQSSLYEHIVKL